MNRRDRLEHLDFRVLADEERGAVLAMRKQIYESELGHHGVDEFDQAAHHLVATEDGRIVSALRIIGPTRPLEIEHFIDLAFLYDHERVPAQIGGFFVDPEERNIAKWGPLPLAMLRFSVAFSTSHRITDLLMRTHVQEIKKLYEFAFFEPLEHLDFDHPHWGEVYVMRLDLVELFGDERKRRSPIGRFLTAAPTPNMHL